MAVELGTGYISIVASTDGIPGQLRGALAGAGGVGEAAGRDMGSRMSSALGAALKTGAVAVAATAGAGIATALTKGWQRLSSIDDATGKLTALGHSAQSTEKILSNAMDSVKGTSYGFGDAASLAGTAVAAGVESGKDLTRYLSLIADTATIANVPLSEMGQIFNKVQTGQRAYTMEITQLADRGIPIWQWLQKEMGATQEELRDLVADGKVTSEDYLNAIEKNIGGAATSATTVSSQWANTMAAMGRLGAAALEPTFGRLAGWMGSGIEAIDNMTDRVGPLAQVLDNKIFEEWGPKLSGIAEAASEMFSGLGDSQLVLGSVSQLRDVFFDLAGVAQDLAPSVMAIVSSLAEASAATGVSAWQVLLNTLDAIAPILDATLVPGLEALASLMEDNQGAVTALMLGFAAFKTLPAIGAMAAAAFAPLRTSLAATAASTTGTRASFAAMRGDFRNLAPQIGATSAAMRALGNNSSTIRGMQNAFIGSSTAAGGFAAAMRQGVAPALAGVRAAASGVRNLFSGGLGIGAAIVVATQLIGAMDDVEDFQQSMVKTANSLAEAQGNVADAFAKTAGSMNADVFDALTEQVSTFRSNLEQTAADAPGFWANVVGGFSSDKSADDRARELAAIGQRAEEAAKAIDQIGASDAEVAAALSGSQTQWDNFVAQLRDVGEWGDHAIEMLQRQRDELLQQREAAKTLSPGIIELAGSFDVLADAAASADDKTSALRQALVALGIIEADSAQVMADYGEAVEDIVSGSDAATDATVGLGEAMLDAGGKLDTFGNANARTLNDALSELGSSFLAAAQDSGDAVGEYEKAQPALEALAEAYNLPIEKVRELAEGYGLAPDVVSTLVRVDGADAATTDLEMVRAFMDRFPDEPLEIRADVIDDGARETLEELGFQVKELENGNIQITADNEFAMAALDAVLNKVHEVDIADAVPTIGADDTAFRIVDEATKESLGNIDRTTVSPEIGALIDQFLAGEAVTLEKLRGIDASKASPEVQLLIQQALADAQVVNAAIDNAARRREAEVRIRFAEDYSAARRSNPGFVGPLAVNANGGIWNLPDQARIEPGRGAGLVQWAEGETGGEAFIPLSPAKRDRSTRILSEVADRFGMRLESYADGGIRRAMDAAYAGTGATYLWGGTGPTGWDCSGWVGYLQQILMGATAVEAAGTRLYTTYSLLGGSTAGLQPGAGPAGTVFVVGTSDEHMAATLNGQPVESGGAHGTSRIGSPAVGAFDSQFHTIFHLPNELIDGGVGNASGVGSYAAAERKPWTEEDQLKLESARISVQQAIEARDKAYANEKKSDADRQQADIKVQQAELKVRELENKRDGIGVADAISIEPAPALEGEMGDNAIRLRQAEIAILDAQLARDRVYSDPQSTSLEKEKADLAVHDARNSLEATKERIAEEEDELENEGDSKKKWGEGGSLKDRIKDYGAQVFGILVDAAIEQVSPFGESRWWSIPLPEWDADKDKKKKSESKKKGSESEDKKPIDELDIPISGFPGVDDQLGFDVDRGIPKWIEEKFIKKLPLKVYDQGGWLNPNEMAINLGNKPEPIFNSPQQLMQFAGGQLDTLTPAVGGGDDFSVHIHNPQFANESKMMRAARDRQEMSMMRQRRGGIF